MTVSQSVPRVRLDLIVHKGGLLAQVQQKDCGRCKPCKDKFKFGGRGTRRQRCSQRSSRSPSSTELGGYASVALSVLSPARAALLSEQMTRPLPQKLEAALVCGPLPLVWGFRRTPRARRLPPAYVLQYHCGDRVPLDRSHLSISIDQYLNRGKRKRRADRHAKHIPLHRAIGEVSRLKGLIAACQFHEHCCASEPMMKAPTHARPQLPSCSHLSDSAHAVSVAAEQMIRMANPYP